ncbi:MAG: 50S ribosomal protein L29 [Saprospiraceae bacterium]|jgi:large subunit ribosomal protein L29|nr:50S ribosomal protein L29 [Saprospiraceae bacterium]MDP4822221.1 50S ribosomal protein L29 [Saprospiraceae bacterium]MDP4997629.1 50S ribosomal protein L29 [Saprospiraceae bacterium]
MATKKHIELQEYSAEELAGELSETENQYQKLRFDHAIRGMDNPLVLREVRRDIARIKMEIRRRELAEMTTEQLALRSKIRRRRSVARKSK